LYKRQRNKRVSKTGKDSFPGNVFFLQTRSVVGVKWESKYLDKSAGKSPADHIADLMVERLIG